MVDSSSAALRTGTGGPVPGGRQDEFVSDLMGAESPEGYDGQNVETNWVCEPAVNYAFLDDHAAFLAVIQNTDNQGPPQNEYHITSRGPDAIHVRLVARPNQASHATIKVKLHCKIIQIGGLPSDPPPNPKGRTFSA